MITTDQATQTSGFSTVDAYRQIYTESFNCGKANAHEMTLTGVIANFGAVETYDCGSAHRTTVLSICGQNITNDSRVSNPWINSGHSK